MEDIREKMEDIREEYRDEFDKDMVKKHPIIFKSRFKPMSETCMCWGFDVEAGWYPLIKKTCEKLQFIIDHFHIDIVADQVKEKFGTLRFYYHIEVNDERGKNVDTILGTIIDDIISGAEMESANICESCGEFGKLRNKGGWLKTLCEKHLEEWKAKSELQEDTKTDVEKLKVLFGF